MFCIIGFFLVVSSLLLWIRIEKEKKKKTYPLTGKCIVITGGTSGLGLQFLKLCYEQKANVVSISRRKINGMGNLMSFSCNLSLNPTKDGLPYIMTKIEDKFGKIDLLVCCAGTCIPGFIEELNLNDARYMMDLNYFGTYNTIKHAINHMKEGGRIVSVSSAMALCGFTGYSAYAGSKWALRGLMESLKEEYHDKYSFQIFYPPNMDTEGYREEEKIKPEITKAFDRLDTTIKPEEAALALLDGIKKGDFTITTSFSTTAMAAASQGTIPIVTPPYHPKRMFYHFLSFFVPIIMLWKVSKIRKEKH